jgi:Tol biopolymer transport system component
MFDGEAWFSMRRGKRYYGGERMVFYTMHRDGKTKRRIAQVRTTTWTVGNASYYYCACAAWSPDGRKIAYEAVTERKKPAIFVMNADGTNPTRLTRLAWSRDENPDWSPDGTQIAFYSERKGNGQVYVMNADGTNQHRVTRDPWYDCCPRWKPASAGPG